jgi:uncharacterized protein YbjT (DUF2867 family)
LLILLTGVTGFVGGALLPRLLTRGRVRCLVRRDWNPPAGTELARGDCLDTDAVATAMQGVETAYYLVHSMAAGSEFAELDLRAARTFGAAARAAGVQRIVYLGALGDSEGALSPHLRSRQDTGAALREAGVPVVEFRAGIVIGAGSSSFEIIRALVERLPVMICPRWVDVRTQPIALEDLLAYLDAALDLPAGTGGIFEIGGSDVVSYGGVMREYARQRGLRRAFIPVPVLTPRLSSLWLRLVARSHAQVGRSLIAGLRNPTTVQSPKARAAFAIVPMSLAAAIRRAISGDLTRSSFVETRQTEVAATPTEAFAPIRRIGGDAGWYYANFLWQLRGWMDRLVGGAGMRPGRTDAEQCRPGDVIDCWRVDVFEPDRRLRLVAQMKLPGTASLEFEVTPTASGSLVRQTATFEPKGVGGRLYWYALLPVHDRMFTGMLKGIASRATRA